VQRFGIERLLKDFLPVLDNLERALDHAGSTTAQSSKASAWCRTLRDHAGEHGVVGFSAWQAVRPGCARGAHAAGERRTGRTGLGDGKGYKLTPAGPARRGRGAKSRTPAAANTPTNPEGGDRAELSHAPGLPFVLKRRGLEVQRIGESLSMPKVIGIDLGTNSCVR